MVRGLDLFRERMRPHEGSIVLIGGAACDDWFSRQLLQFRATQDLDIVLIIELIDAAALTALREFIREGGYRSRFRRSGSPELFRFADPTDERFPRELELFSRAPSDYDLAPGDVIPVSMEPDHHSLSAILLNDAYYDLIRTHHDTRDGLGISNAIALIPLKAYAWLDLSRLKKEGQHIDSKKILKHRSDVFRLAATLPAGPGPVLSEEILQDLRRFLLAFPPASSDWPGILAAVKDTVGVTLTSTALREAIATYFRLTD
jgi:hypothetical protein